MVKANKTTVSSCMNSTKKTVKQGLPVGSVSAFLTVQVSPPGDGLLGFHPRVVGLVYVEPALRVRVCKWTKSSSTEDFKTPFREA